MRQRGVNAGDVVVGIAASGRTPFVIAGLDEARRRGAKTVFLTCNPHRPAMAAPPDVAVDIPTGPEFLTGSTRLAAGTATKIALNLLSTLAMVRLGKVRDNLMIDVNATNAKLRDRATRIVMELTGWDESKAGTALAQHGWNIRSALASGPGDACPKVATSRIFSGGMGVPPV
jgi:N-acetylmuramic acid 6-phosphate etherase